MHLINIGDIIRTVTVEGHFFRLVLHQVHDAPWVSVCGTSSNVGNMLILASTHEYEKVNLDPCKLSAFTLKYRSWS